MNNKLRLGLVTALVAGALSIGAAPASATCRPESKIPCEPEYPPIREWTENCSTSFDPGLPVSLGVCDL